MNIHTPHAQLWVGHHAQVIRHIEDFLQSLWCTKNRCNSCIACTQIKKRQHHGLLWLCPEKQYTLETLEPVFHTLSFARTAAEPFFFIFEKADFLSIACANRLLKTLEEPPAGYYFICIALRRDALPQTVQSRCVIREFLNSQPDSAHGELFKALAHTVHKTSLFGIVEKISLSDQETIIIAHQLLSYWTERYATASMHANIPEQQKALALVELYTKALASPPMPGSSKIFWRNIVLQLMQHH